MGAKLLESSRIGADTRGHASPRVSALAYPICTRLLSLEHTETLGLETSSTVRAPRPPARPS